MLQGKYPLLIALVLGLMAGLIAYSAIKARERSVVREWATVHVLCAKEMVPQGTELEESMVGVCEIPEKFVTESFFTVSGDQLPQMPYGQKVLVPLHARDPILHSHFESVRDFVLAENVPARARAIAVEVNEKGSVNQWIRPNDHVDVLGTFREENRDLVTVTLMQNAIVLATGRLHGHSTHATEEDKRYSHVVLLATPREAEILTLAQESGTVALVLRNPNDLEVEDVVGMKTDNKSLFTGQRERYKERELAFQKREPTLPKDYVEIIQGNKKDVEKTGIPVQLP